MSNVDLDKAPLVAPKPNKIFGTVDTPVDFIEAFGAEKTVKRALSALLRVPIRFYRDNVIASEGDAAEHIFFVVRGVVRSCKIFKHPQHRRLLSARRPLWLDGSQTLAALNRGRDRHRGAISQTECVAVHRITGKSSCKVFASRNNK
jgi:hypothetical protein